MAQEESSGALKSLSTTDSIAALIEAYEQLTIPIRQYIFLILIPSFVFFVLTISVVFVLNLPTLISVPIPLLGSLIFLTALIYPKLTLEQKRVELENNLHLVLTHMTVLSTTNIDRVEVFRRLSQEDEYGALANEIDRVVRLVDTWNQSLDDALRRRAKEVPSKPLADFFDRLAYTLSAGQDLSDFLLREQSVVIQNYVTIYEGSLDNLEVMKDLYLSMILSMTFALVFAVVLPILTGTDPSMTVGAVIVLFIFIQLGFAYAIRSVVPHDPVWYLPQEIEPESRPRIRRSLILGASLSFFLGILVAGDLFGFLPIDLTVLSPTGSIPIPIYAVLPVTPLLIPGLIVRQQEGKIKQRDKQFPSFIRSLGASESAKQSTTSAVLKDLRKKDFGALTEDVDNLYKRLNMRIEPAKAWRYFSVDSQSYLIQKFSEMYLIGRQMGGEPKQLGELISENMSEVIQLRERRTQSTITLIGLLYGISAAASFAFFIGLQVVQLLSDMSLTLSEQSDINQLISTESYNIPAIQFLLILVILFNAMLSSLMIRTVDGGHPANAYLHFVSLSWVGALVAVFTVVMTGAFLNV